MNFRSVPAPSSASMGSMMAFGAMSCVQLGLAASIVLAENIGSEAVAWLRLAWAAVILVVIARPWKLKFTRNTLMICALLGLATAGMTVSFMKSVETIALGTASALEFMGPLAVAIIQGRGSARWWAVIAALGVLGLTEPWHGAVDLTGVLYALGGAVCWAVYVLLTQRAGDAVEGVGALAVSMPVAAIAATFMVGPGVLAAIDMQTLVIGVGLALLLPVIPFSLEIFALRRLTTAAFGTLMCLEPAIAMTVGLLILHQVPRPAAIVGIALVILAGIGATRTGQRVPKSIDSPAVISLAPVAEDHSQPH